MTDANMPIAYALRAEDRGPSSIRWRGREWLVACDGEQLALSAVAGATALAPSDARPIAALLTVFLGGALTLIGTASATELAAVVGAFTSRVALVARWPACSEEAAPRDLHFEVRRRAVRGNGEGVVLVDGARTSAVLARGPGGREVDLRKLAAAVDFAAVTASRVVDLYAAGRGKDPHDPIVVLGGGATVDTAERIACLSPRRVAPL